MEDRILKKMLTYIVLCFELIIVSCNNHNEVQEEWSYFHTHDMDVFYIEKQKQIYSYSFYRLKDNKSFAISETIDITCFNGYLPSQLQNDIKHKLIVTNQNYGFPELSSCLAYASKIYNIDSLSSISCWTVDFPRAAIYISENLEKYTCRTGYREKLEKLFKEPITDNLINEINKVERNYRKEIESRIKETNMEKEMNNILSSFKLKVEKIKVAPEAHTICNDKKFFIEHLNDTTNLAIPDSILYVPIVISINNMNK